MKKSFLHLLAWFVILTWPVLGWAEFSPSDSKVNIDELKEIILETESQLNRYQEDLEKAQKELHQLNDRLMKQETSYNSKIQANPSEPSQKKEWMPAKIEWALEDDLKGGSK
jgi:biopolymer transport protein ExbB/TolQ